MPRAPGPELSLGNPVRAFADLGFQQQGRELPLEGGPLLIDISTDVDPPPDTRALLLLLQGYTTLGRQLGLGSSA